MKARIIASTKVGYELPVQEALDFGGKSAAICYMPDTFETIMEEPAEKTAKRVDQTLNSKHHSVFGHATYNILFTDIPKILAMVLNNEGIYNTSEKSARYTKMNPSEKERVLYDKWLNIFKNLIKERYDKIPSAQVEKLAQENARYMISVFTPTTMEYTVSHGQLNYIVGMMHKFIDEQAETSFNTHLKIVMKEFISEVSGLAVEGLDGSIKDRSLALFDTERLREEEFGENYSTNYWASLAHLAQAQRHRTLHYKMWINEKNPSFYVPLIITEHSGSLVTEWLGDIMSVADLFPQGTLVRVNERGTYEQFMLKCMERLCGCAQLEIMNQTIDTFKKYKEHALEFFDAYHELSGIDSEFLSKGYDVTPRCKFPNWKCNKACIWGPNEAFERLI